MQRVLGHRGHFVDDGRQGLRQQIEVYALAVEDEPPWLVVDARHHLSPCSHTSLVERPSRAHTREAHLDFRPGHLRAAHPVRDLASLRPPRGSHFARAVSPEEEGERRSQCLKRVSLGADDPGSPCVARLHNAHPSA